MPFSLNPMTDTRESKKLNIANSLLLKEVATMIAEGHTVTLPLKGASMRPFLDGERDKAVLAKPREKAMEGDVVLAETSPGFYVLHRIVGVSGDQITLRGDGNLQAEHCSQGDIKAMATAFYRKGRQTPDEISGLKWRLYSWLWTTLFPIRRYLLFINRKLFTQQDRQII